MGFYWKTAFAFPLFPFRTILMIMRF